VITNREEGKGKPPRLFPKTGYLLGYPEPALWEKTEEREREFSVCVCVCVCVVSVLSINRICIRNGHYFLSW